MGVLIVLVQILNIDLYVLIFQQLKPIKLELDLNHVSAAFTASNS